MADTETQDTTAAVEVKGTYFEPGPGDPDRSSHPDNPSLGVRWDPETDKRAEQLARLAKAPKRLVESFREEAAKIDDDGRYSEDYREKMKAELAEKYLAGKVDARPTFTLGEAENNLRRIAGPVRKEARELRATPEADPTDARGAIRERELREHLRSLDADRRMDKARQWALSDDPEKARAVLDADSELVGFAAPETQERLRRQRIQELHGRDKLEELDAMDRLARTAEHNLEMARRELRSVAEKG